MGIIMPIIFVIGGFGLIIFGILSIKSNIEDFRNSKAFEGEIIELREAGEDSDYDNVMTYSPVIRYFDYDRDIEFDMKSNFYEDKFYIGQKVKLRLYLKNYKEGDMPIFDPESKSWIGFTAIFFIGTVFIIGGGFVLKMVLY